MLGLKSLVGKVRTVLPKAEPPAGWPTLDSFLGFYLDGSEYPEGGTALLFDDPHAFSDGMAALLASLGRNAGPATRNGAVYVTFKVNAADALPDNMTTGDGKLTIILQHQYEKLESSMNEFSVTVRFSGLKYRLTVPYEDVVSVQVPSWDLSFWNVGCEPEL